MKAEAIHKKLCISAKEDNKKKIKTLCLITISNSISISSEDDNPFKSNNQKDLSGHAFYNYYTIYEIKI